MNKISAFSERLEQAMHLKGLTQKELSDRTGITKSAISQYLKGMNEPRHEKLYKLSEVLQINESWLMGYDTDILPGKIGIPEHFEAYLNSPMHQSDMLWLNQIINDYHALTGKNLNDLNISAQELNDAIDFVLYKRQSNK